MSTDFPDENDVLIDLVCSLSKIIDAQQAFSSEMQSLTKRMKEHNTTYFKQMGKDPTFQEFLHTFSRTNQLQDAVLELMAIKSYVVQHLKTTCKHKWVRDTIDVGFEETEDIVYCADCETTLRY